MKITRKTTRRWEEKRRWDERNTEKERETEHEQEAEEKRKEERISFWQMSIDENNIRKYHVKTSKENDKSSFQETLKKDHQVMTKTRKQKLRIKCLKKKNLKIISSA